MSNDVDPVTGKFAEPSQDDLDVQDVVSIMGEFDKVPLTAEVAKQLKDGIDTAVQRDNTLKQVFEVCLTVLKAAAGVVKPCIGLALCLPLLGCGVSTEFIAAQKVSNAQLEIVVVNMDRERTAWATALRNAEAGHATTLYHYEWNKAVNDQGMIRAVEAQTIMGRYRSNLDKIDATVAAGVAKGAQNSDAIREVLNVQHYIVTSEEKLGKFDPSAFAQGLISIGQAGADAYKAMKEPPK